MASLLKTVGEFLVKVIPGTGVRTIVIAIGQLLYAILGVFQFVSSNGASGLSPEQAGVIASTAIGLLVASKHKPN